MDTRIFQSNISSEKAIVLAKGNRFLVTMPYFSIFMRDCVFLVRTILRITFWSNRVYFSKLVTHLRSLSLLRKKEFPFLGTGEGVGTTGTEIIWGISFFSDDPFWIWEFRLEFRNVKQRVRLGHLIYPA